MPLPLLGFVVAQLGLRAIPVLLRSGQYAMRYLITTPGAKGKAMQELGKRVLGKNAVVDDLAKLTSKKADNIVSKIIDPNKLTASERTTLMNTTYRDSSKLLQSQKSYPSNAKLASDIEKGFGQSFSKESSGRLFIAGDRTAVATKETLKKVTEAPKALPKPGTLKKVPDIKKGPDLIKAEKLAAEKAALETTKGKLATGTITRKDVLQLPKESRKQILRLRKVEKKLKTAATGTETGPVIAEGLHGPTALGKQLAERGWKISKEATTKPAWWQAMIPNVLRVGGQPYKGAYPAGVSAERVGATTGGLLFAGATIPSLSESMTKKHLAKEDILSAEQIMAMSGDAYANAYDPNAMIDKLESGDVILPERIE